MAQMPAVVLTPRQVAITRCLLPAAFLEGTAWSRCSERFRDRDGHRRETFGPWRQDARTGSHEWCERAMAERASKGTHAP